MMKLRCLGNIFFCCLLSVGSPVVLPRAFGGVSENWSYEIGVSESWSYEIGKSRQIVDQGLKHQDKELAQQEYAMDYSQPNPRPRHNRPLPHAPVRYKIILPSPPPPSSPKQECPPIPVPLPLPAPSALDGSG